MAEEFHVRVKRYQPTDPRLGRHVYHDSRSLQFPHPETSDPTKLKSVRHHRYVPVFDQGQVGSCTGNASTGCLGTSDPYWASGQSVLSATDEQVDETYALGVYSDAEVLDGNGPYVPNDPSTDHGSSGLSVAQVLKSRGLISGYTHAFSLEATLTALAAQPVIIGIPWNADMFNPANDGRIKITGATEGGHEICLDELDVENRRAWITNSWAESWGVEGRGYFTWDDLGSVLADDGDCTVFVPQSKPAPKPTPPGPVNPNPPSPEKPSVVQEVEQEIEKFIQAMENFINELRG